jgi:hypothetical protein
VVKRSVSLPEQVFRDLEQEAQREGLSLSGALSDAAQQWLVVRRGLRAVREWEAEHGALTSEELAEADAAAARAEARADG